MAIPLPFPYIPGGGPVPDADFQDGVQQNLDTLALKALPTSDVSTFIRGLLNDPDAATARTTLGAAPLNNPVFTGGITALGGSISDFAYVQLEEVPDPTAASNAGRLYCRDNGSGKTQLCIQFGTGSPIVLVTEV